MKIITKIFLMAIFSTLMFTLTACDPMDYFSSTTSESGTSSSASSSTTTNQNTSFGIHLYNSLHTSVTIGRTYLTYSQAWTVLQSADEDPSNSSNIICFYTGKSIPKADRDSPDATASILWNREHVWPASKGIDSSSATNTNYADCFNLHATEKNINATRGNLDFSTTDGRSSERSDSYGNTWITGTTSYSCFEPRDEVKGDVARTIFYMLVAYNNLHPTDTLPSSGSYMGKFSTLFQWNIDDPVSINEINRDTIISSYQRNHNPFITDASLVNLIWNPDGSYKTSVNTSENSSYDVNATNLWFSEEQEAPDDNKTAEIVIYSLIGVVGIGTLAFIVVKYIHDVKVLKSKEMDDNNDEDNGENSSEDTK